MAKKSKNTGFLSQTISMKSAVLFMASFAVLGGLVVWQAGAAPGGKGGSGGKPIKGTSGTISDPILTTDLNSDGLLNWNDKIKFNVTAVGLSAPFVNLKCYVNGSLVSQGYEGYFAASLDDGIFGLASPVWAGGAADCTANLINSTQTYVYATKSFRVNP